MYRPDTASARCSTVRPSATTACAREATLGPPPARSGAGGRRSRPHGLARRPSPRSQVRKPVGSGGP
ncbi:hypothetical protein NI18_19600 [Sphingomonas sp. Ant20]|nr:hypothetical protein NI18_19600 [Sphingomonas sp. Ant20]